MKIKKSTGLLRSGGFFFWQFFQQWKYFSTSSRIFACDEFLTTGNIKNSVNYPNVAIPHTGAARVCVFHKNIPNMLNAITAAFKNVNIENMANGSRGDYAYTIVEVSSAIPADVEAACRAIEGVIRVRVL